MESPQQNGSARNLLLRLSYDGTDFFGWQVQPDRPTIQGTLADTVMELCSEKVEICGSGRTDAGVHACAQAANVRIHAPIPCPNLLRALNRLLPDSIRILSVQRVSHEFHARHDAQSKIYRYRIFRGQICPPQIARYVLPYAYPLEEAEMARAAALFQGTLDFRSFAAADECEDDGGDREKSYVRSIFSSVLERHGEELVYTVEGSGFLRHMVRNIVGTLIDVGRDRIMLQKVPEILAAARRSAAGPTAPARGLHLVSVRYAPEALHYPPLDNGRYPAKIE